MTDEQILEKALEKARENDRWYQPPMPIIFGDVLTLAPHPYTIIFSHDFAEAFFGKEYTASIDADELKLKKEMPVDPIPAWQYHLQQMALATHRLQYIKKFL